MHPKNKPTIVIDTNLIISAIIRKSTSTPYLLLKAWRENKFQLVMSEELFVEVEEVLKREKIYKKYNITHQQIEALLRELRNAIDLVKPLKPEDLTIHSRDKKDDKLLACAIGGNCDYLITGDEDLLVLSNHPAVGELKIVKALDFLKR